MSALEVLHSEDSLQFLYVEYLHSRRHRTKPEFTCKSGLQVSTSCIQLAGSLQLSTEEKTLEIRAESPN